MNKDKQIYQTTFLIIGGGIAGVSCAEHISFICPQEKITLLTETSLIKAVTNLIPLGKLTSKFEVIEQSSDVGINERVTVIVDVLSSINSSDFEIITKSGQRIKYKYLCLCTGARPKLIEENNSLIIGIRDTESVIDFQKRIKNSRKIVIVGNGGIASEIVYEIKNLKIDWIIKDNHISSTFVDPGGAEFFQKSLKKNLSTSSASTIVKRMRYSEESNKMENKNGAALGPDWHRHLDMSGNTKNVPEPVNIHYKTEIKSVVILEDPSEFEFPLNVTLTNGEIIKCDFLVSATGVDPRINFDCDKEFKLGPDGGLFVNDMMSTNIPGIFAAGDVCYAGWPHNDSWFQMRLWTQARQMGAMAGRSMAASFTGEIIYQDFCFELFSHVTTLFGYQVVLLGRYNGQGLGNDYEILLRITPEKEYIKFILKNGKLRGAILIGETGLEETCENLILNQLDLSPYGDDILNPDIDIEDYFD